MCDSSPPLQMESSRTFLGKRKNAKLAIFPNFLSYAPKTFFYPQTLDEMLMSRRKASAISALFDKKNPNAKKVIEGIY